MSSPDDAPAIVVVSAPMEPRELKRLTELFFGDMVKLVIDVERKLVAVGGELHADAEAILLEAGSRQADVWGANYYPGLGPDQCLEYTALVNIRPAQGNRSMEVQDPATRERIAALVHALIGTGGSL